MNYPISACILAKDEEEHIRGCLDSVRPFVSEIIVLDTGSKDSTCEIASSFGAVVKKTVWYDDFAQARNELINYVTQPYILIIDADERLLDGKRIDFGKEIKLLEEFPFKAGRVQILNYIEENNLSESEIIRFFSSSPDFHYTGRIHEQLYYRGHPPETFSTSIRLSHLGYSKHQINKKNKISRNIKLLEIQLQAYPNDAYTLFQIGRTYFVNEQYIEAQNYLEEALRASSREFRYYSSIINTLGWAYIKTKKWNELLQLLDITIKELSDYTDLYYIYGCALIEMQKIEAFKLIPQAFIRCLELGEADTSKYETLKGVGSYLAHYNLGLYYELIGELDRAKRHYIESRNLDYNPAAIRLSQMS